MIDTKGLKPSLVLCALYNASRPQGMGFMQYTPEPLNETEAALLLDKTKYFDYLKGRVMKVDLSDPNGFDPWGYDRDNGQDAAQRAIDKLRAGCVNDKDAHAKGVQETAADARAAIEQPTTVSGNTVSLGMRDVRDHLKPKLDKLTQQSN